MHRKVGYLMSRFPVVTETFILYEVLELEKRGLEVEVYPLLGRNSGVVHPGAEGVIERTHYLPYLSWDLLAAQWHWLKKGPGAYLGAWWEALKGNVKSPGFFARALFVVPRAALFAKELREKGVTHVHAHWATHPALAAFVIKRLTGLPYSFTCHAHDLYVDRAMLEKKIDEASFVATISEYNRKMMMDLYGEAVGKKIVVVRCGVDASVFQPARGTGRAGEAPFTFACVAALRDYKGQSFLIDACAQLKAQGVKFQVLCVGEGPNRPELEAQIERLGLGDEVKLLGQQPRDRVQEILSGADAVVMPSIVTKYGKKEGIPVALMEALASELPVVATAISGIPELILDGVTGLLVPEQNADALAEAMGKLTREPALGNRLAAAGRRKVLREFNLEHNVARLEGLLRAGRPTPVLVLVPPEEPLPPTGDGEDAWARKSAV